MSPIQELSERVAPPAALAALLLVAISLLQRIGLPHPGATEALAALDVSRSRAYALQSRLWERLAACRPHRETAFSASRAGPHKFATKLVAFLQDHPGAVSGSAQRRTYSRAYRLFVLDLVDDQPEVTLQELADDICLPRPTLKDWMRGESLDDALAPIAELDVDARSATITAKEAQISTLLDEYQRWDGAFTAFCDHVHNALHLPFGRTAISTHAHGVRRTAQGALVWASAWPWARPSQAVRPEDRVDGGASEWQVQVLPHVLAEGDEPTPPALVLEDYGRDLTAPNAPSWLLFVGRGVNVDLHCATSP